MANKINIIISAEDKASKPLRQVSEEMDNTSRSSSKVGSVMSGALRVGIAATIAGSAALTGGLIAASKASYDQVKAVEEARYGLLAYEKDGKKVEKVLSGLVSYAKSDMGVLFNRKDMFAAASTLKMYGNETDTLTERVKILSKGVSQGKTTFQELSAIVGRAAAKGRLDAVDFDMLIERGIGLDRSFRGTAVSVDELWKALDKALPDKLLEDRANTIEGRMIRLQTAFREVGNAVLGVDKDTNQFIKGGLGDRFIMAIGHTTSALKYATPVIADMSSKLSNLIGDIPNFIQAWQPFAPMLIGATVAVVSYNVATGTATLATRAWTAAQLLLNNAMKLNPFVLVASAAAGIISAYAAVVMQTDNSRNANDRLRSAQDQLRLSTDAAKDAQDRLRGALLSEEGAALAVERAQLNYNRAVQQFGPSSLEAREASHQLNQAQRSLADSAAAVRDRTNEARQAEQNKAAAAGAVVAANHAVGSSAYSAAGGYAALRDRINEAAAADRATGVNNGFSGKNQTNAVFGLPKGFATGTSYAPGGATLVGENGPELVNMPRGAQVTQAYRTRNQLAQEGSGGVTNILSGTFTFQNAEAVQAFFNRLDKTQRLAKFGMAS